MMALLVSTKASGASSCGTGCIAGGMEQGQPLQRKIPEAGASSGPDVTWGLESFGQNMGTGGFQEQFLVWDVSWRGIFFGIFLSWLLVASVASAASVASMAPGS